MAEITPAAGSYSYGSTSELSPSTTVETSSSSLADTGQPFMLLTIAAVSLIVLGVGLVIANTVRLKRKAKS